MSTPYVAIYHPLLTAIPQELGKLDHILAAQAKEVGLFQTCTEVRGPQELETLPAEAHTSEPLLRHAAEHGVPISIPRGMDKEEIEAAICYGTHASANN